MDEETCLSIPEEITFREIKFSTSEPGFRTRSIIVITTLTEPAEFSKAAIAEIHGYRWNAELDIRSIKASLNLEHARSQSPEMVRRELWPTILGYNLIRSKAAAAAMLHNVRPRQISFTSIVQIVLQEWMLLSRGDSPTDNLIAFIERMRKGIANCRVANRPGRIEPGVVERRHKPYNFMMRPRNVLRKELLNS